MIAASELRITNLVEYNREFKTVAQLFNISNNKSWNPIPLDEDWLIEFGFKMNTLNTYSNDKLMIKWEGGKCEMLSGVHIEIKHVHQLQNLYFALTGEELELK